MIKWLIHTLFGCFKSCKWKEPLVNSENEKIGTWYNLQCEHCGSIKRKKLLLKFMSFLEFMQSETISDEFVSDIKKTGKIKLFAAISSERKYVSLIGYGPTPPNAVRFVEKIYYSSFKDNGNYVFFDEEDYFYILRVKTYGIF